MNKIIIFLSTILLLTSCNSTKKDSAFVNEELLRENKLQNSKIVLEDATVFIDQVQEEELSLQVQNILNLKLESFNSTLQEKNEVLENSNAENNLRFSVYISERTFMQNFEQRHSIFATAKLFDKDNNCCYKNCFYTISKLSISSSFEQKNFTEKIIEDLYSQFNKKF